MFAMDHASFIACDKYENAASIYNDTSRDSKEENLVARAFEIIERHHPTDIAG